MLYPFPVNDLVNNASVRDWNDCIDGFTVGYLVNNAADFSLVVLNVLYLE